VGVRISDHETLTFSANYLEEEKLLELKNEVPYKLREIILPALQENLRLLAITFGQFDSQGNHPTSWYKTLLNNLMGIDEVLEQLDLSIMAIWNTYEPEQGSLADNSNVEHLTRYRAEITKERIADFLARQLCNMFYECAAFLSGSTLRDPFGGVIASATQKHNYINTKIIRRIPLLSNDINSLIQWLQQSLLSVSKTEWQELLDLQIEPSLTLLQKPIRFKADRSYISEGESDDDSTAVNGTIGKFVQAAIQLIKVCRLYFNKLLKSNTSSLLIFVRPSMNIEANQLKLLLQCSAKINQDMQGLTYNITRWPTRRRRTVDMVVKTMRDFTQFSAIFEKYWDSLLERNDPLVNREMIEDARRWINTWTSLFFDIARQAMQATGCKYTWPPKLKIEHTTDEDVIMED
jgi:hypothetical protein